MDKPITDKKRPLIVGVAGGSGSGKTTVVNHIYKALGKNSIALLQHDSYYRDLDHLPIEDRLKHNFDHPSSLETELLIRHINALTNGYPVDVPIYDFTNHARKKETLKLSPRKVILIDGILIFSEPDLKNLMDVKIFVDTDSDIRLMRRLKRDITERGRTVESVIDQYQTFVRPMHLEFVEPSKRYADIIIPRGGKNKVAMEMVVSLIKSKLD